jgi:low affinity Fe/Cu permease
MPFPAEGVNMTIWIGISVVVFLVLYILIMRLFFHESRALEKRIDYKNIRRWERKDSEGHGDL